MRANEFDDKKAAITPIFLFSSFLHSKLRRRQAKKLRDDAHDLQAISACSKAGTCAHITNKFRPIFQPFGLIHSSFSLSRTNEKKTAIFE